MKIQKCVLMSHIQSDVDIYAVMCNWAAPVHDSGGIPALMNEGSCSQRNLHKPRNDLIIKDLH